jgi:hypothetical protein
MSRHAVFIELRTPTPGDLRDLYRDGKTRGESLELALNDLIGPRRYRADLAVDWLTINVDKIRMPQTR